MMGATINLKNTTSKTNEKVNKTGNNKNVTNINSAYQILEKMSSIYKPLKTYFGGPWVCGPAVFTVAWAGQSCLNDAVEDYYDCVNN